MSDSELASLRARLRKRQKAAMHAPKLYLTLDKMESRVNSHFPEVKGLPSDQPPLFLIDLQHLLLFAIQGNMASYKPRWCTLLRWTRISRIALFVVDGVSSVDCKQFPFVKETFQNSVELTNPSQFGQTVAGELFRVPVSSRLLHCATKAGKSFPVCKDETKANQSTSDPVCNEKLKNDESELSMPSQNGDLISRLDLLLNTEQMVMEGFPMPSTKAAERTKDYVFSCFKYKQVTDASPLFGLDCEMCHTTIGHSELTRVAITNEQGECVMDELVMPPNKITNYLTEYSGITKKILENVTTSIKTVQETIQKLLPPDAILVGQSLNSDLHALKMFHPYIIDTSLIYNISGLRSHKTKLKTLSSLFLNREIQTGGKFGHNPCEDALAALELVKLKLRNGLEFGDVILGGPLPCPSNATDNGSNVTSDHHPAPSDNNATTSDVPKMIQSCSEINKPRCSINQTEKQFFSVASASMHYRDFFELAQKSNRSVAVGGFGSSLPESKCMVRLQGESDRQLASQCQQALTDNFMICVQFTGARDTANEESKQVALRKVDKRIRKVMKSMEARSLAVVLLSGDHEQYNSAMCFVSIT